jgi:DNA-binding XRE family transcriptional regulator
MSESSLRGARERLGLTQVELARRAGVSRQLVSGVEAGRHVPSVDAAIGLARVLGVSVERLFGPSQAPAVSVLGAPLVEGEPVLAGHVGDRLAAAPLGTLAQGDAGWASADGVVEDGAVRLLAGARATGLVVVGCDPVLGICDALLNRDGARRMVAVSGSSGAGITALAAGRAHAALVHGPEGRLPAPPVAARRVHLARWRVGIGLGEAGRSASLEGVLAGAVPLVQREESAASQQALARSAARAGVALPPAAATAGGHIEAARRAASTGAAGLTFEPAARRHGLGFLLLEVHDVEIWIDARWVDHPGARALGDLLVASAFRSRVELVGGYDLGACGTVLAA